MMRLPIGTPLVLTVVWVMLSMARPAELLMQ